MKILGVDASINSSGLFKLTLDNDLNVIKREHFGFTDVKKNQRENIFYFQKKNFKDNLEKDLWMVEKIKEIASDCEYISVEDFSFASVGNTFDIGAFVGLVKYTLYQMNKKIRLYPPTSVKKFFTNRGTASKLEMWERWKTEGLDDLDYLGEITESKGKPILSDCVDAYALAYLLRHELLIRRGLLSLKELTEEQITIFNKVQKKSGTNILDTEFLERTKQ